MPDSIARSATRPAPQSSDWLGVLVKYSKPVRRTGWVGVVAGLAGVTGLAGCGGLDPVPPYQNLITDPTQIYTTLRIDYRALTLSTDPSCQCATWQLTATPRDARGGAMEHLPAPTFRPLVQDDTLTVRVTADGKVTAAQPGSTKILAELAIGNVRHADTALIDVQNPTPLPTLASLSIDALPPFGLPNIPMAAEGDANYLVDQFGNFLPLFAGEFILIPASYYPLPVPRVLDTQGNDVTALPFDFQLLDDSIAKIFPAADQTAATWQPVGRRGQARVVVRTTAYGKTVEDTAVITLTWPKFAPIYAMKTSSTTFFKPNEIRIAPNGTVLWYNVTDQPIEVTFEDPTNVLEATAALCAFFDNTDGFGPAPNCATGNFTLDAPSATPPVGFPAPILTVQARRFPVPGTYVYHASTGTTGRIVVE